MKYNNLFIIIAIAIVSLFIVTGCEKKNEEDKVNYDYLVLVNKYSKLPDDWESKVELVDDVDAWGDGVKVEKNAHKKFKELQKALEDEGVYIELDSIYRSVADQQDLWDRWSKDPEKGIEYVKKFVAVPGYSEHHTGLAIDICLKKDGEIIADNDEMIAEKEIFAKIHSKLADYGFILRYPKDKEKTTGYTYEPWHLRYVNSVEIAKEIMDNNITFEDYLLSIKDIKNNNEAAKLVIEKTLEKEFKNKIYKNKITDVRFNVRNIYNTLSVEGVNLGENDLAFDVEYELKPSKGADINLLMIPDGEYDKTTGWIKNMGRVGILRVNGEEYKIDNLGTGW